MPGLLFFQQVADFGQQLYVGGWSRRSRGRFGLFLPVESVDQLDEQEDCKSDDDEVESRLKKIPVVNRHGRDDFARCGCLATSEETILPKAAPITTPTARSITLPRMANCLNSSMSLLFIIQGFDMVPNLVK